MVPFAVHGTESPGGHPDFPSWGRGLVSGRRIIAGHPSGRQPLVRVPRLSRRGTRWQVLLRSTVCHLGTNGWSGGNFDFLYGRSLFAAFSFPDRLAAAPATRCPALSVRHNAGRPGFHGGWCRLPRGRSCDSLERILAGISDMAAGGRSRDSWNRSVPADSCVPLDTATTVLRASRTAAAKSPRPEVEFEILVTAGANRPGRDDRRFALGHVCSHARTIFLSDFYSGDVGRPEARNPACCFVPVGAEFRHRGGAPLVSIASSVAATNRNVDVRRLCGGSGGWICSHRKTPHRVRTA